MFFEDADLTPRKHARIRALPRVPATGWKPPAYFPNLHSAVVIACDVETKETDFDNGPGWARNCGHIVGVSLAAIAADGTRGKWYFPVRHEVETENNLDPRQVFGWLKTVLETSRIPKVFANALYDIGWLTSENIYVTGELHDVQFAEALIDEQALVALEELGYKYLGVGKTTDVLKEWCQKAYPNTPKTKWRGDIHRAPPSLVGHYAEDDADLPLDILLAQANELDQQGLGTVYRLECDIIPLLIRMRLEGAQVDIPRAEELDDQMSVEIAGLYNRVKAEYDFSLESSHSNQLGPLFKHVGISTPYTDAGNPSVTADWLAGLEHPLGQLVRDIREREKLQGTFLRSYILNKNINGKVYPQFHPLKGETNGAKVGRFASSDPNLQNIPARTKLGKLVRECFIPDYGHAHWRKMDYSQIHYRILAHYAVGQGADELRQRYISNPKTDYHQDVLNNVAPLVGWDITDAVNNAKVRRPIKNVNFGLLYGQTEPSLAKKIAGYFGGASFDTKQFFKHYHEGAPYVKATMEAIGEEVQTHGYVTSVLGRRCRFNLWEPNYEWGKTPLPYDDAIAEYGSCIKRAFEYRGVNYKFQSSEPDIMKTGMLKCLRSGVFDAVGVPRLTVHDELDFSVRDRNKETDEAFAFIKHTMQDAVKLNVPVFVDTDDGPNWGKVD